MKKVTKIAIVFLAGLLIAGSVYAKFAKPEEAIGYRKGAMTLMGHHFKRMGAVVQGKMTYDKAAFTADAEIVKVIATLPWEAMLMPGSDEGSTTMSSAVFKKTDAFKKIAADLEKATAQLAEASKSKDLEAIKAQFGMVATNCKACHGAFRK